MSRSLKLTGSNRSVLQIKTLTINIPKTHRISENRQKPTKKTSRCVQRISDRKVIKENKTGKYRVKRTKLPGCAEKGKKKRMEIRANERSPRALAISLQAHCFGRTD